jgi:IclR family acetate operon transcriptional repressor
MRNGPLATAAQTTNSVGENGAGRYRIQAIERAVSILNAFTPDEPEMGVSDLAQRLSLHKSTVHRFVVNLEAAGLLERNRTTSRYRLGLRIFELGSQVLAQMNLWEEAPPFLEGLVRDTGETGHLAIFDGGEAIYIEKVEARRALRIPSAIGRGYPAHATSLGKALLAHQSPHVIEAVIAERGLARCASRTICEREQLLDELERVRQVGYAIDDEEYEEGLRCIGAPIVGHTGTVVAAIGIGGPVTRVTPDRVRELGQVVMEAAAGLSHRMGAGQSGAFAPTELRVRTQRHSLDNDTKER